MAATPESAELVRTIIAMAHALHLSVVAESIETCEQLTQLEALGCSYGQGYLFAKLLAAPQAALLLQSAQLEQQGASFELPAASSEPATP